MASSAPRTPDRDTGVMALLVIGSIRWLAQHSFSHIRPEEDARSRLSLCVLGDSFGGASMEPGQRRGIGMPVDHVEQLRIFRQLAKRELTSPAAAIVRCWDSEEGVSIRQ